MIYFAMSFFAAFILVSLVFLAQRSPILPELPSPGECLTVIGELGSKRLCVIDDLLRDTDHRWFMSARDALLSEDVSAIAFIPSFDPRRFGETEMLDQLLQEGRRVVLTVTPHDVEWFGRIPGRGRFYEVMA